jgi:hypothetical protein
MLRATLLATVCFTNLGKLNFDYKLEPIYATDLAASKNEAHVKSGQK